MDRESQNFFDNKTNVIELTPSDFDQISTWKLKDHRCAIVLFYMPWCPHCVDMISTWNRLADINAYFDVCAFNCEKNRNHVLKINEDSPNLIGPYPTIIFYSKGKPVEYFHDEQNRKDLKVLSEACLRACGLK